MDRVGRVAPFVFALVFFFEASRFLAHPGIEAAELQWGPVKAALYRLLLEWRPPSPELLRIPPILVSACTVIVAGLFLRRASGGTAAVVGSGVVALDAMFLIASRTDAAGITSGCLFLTSGLWLGVRFWQQTSLVSLAGAGACLGLAAAARVQALFVVAGFAIAAAIVFWREIATVLGARTATCFCGGLALGLSSMTLMAPLHFPPVSRANLLDCVSGFAWFGPVVRSEPGTLGIGPDGWFQTDVVRIAAIFGSTERDLMPLIVPLALGLAAVAWLRRLEESRGVRFLACAFVIGSAGLELGRAPLLLWPLPGMLVGAAAVWIARRWILGMVASIAVIAALLCSDEAVTFNYYSHALLYGGTLPFTEATYNLVRDFDFHDTGEVYILTPSAVRPVRYLSGRENSVHAYPDPGLQNPLLPENALFVTSGDEVSRANLTQLVQATHRRIYPVRFIQDRQGRSVFELFRLD